MLPFGADLRHRIPGKLLLSWNGQEYRVVSPGSKFRDMGGVANMTAWIWLLTKRYICLIETYHFLRHYPTAGNGVPFIITGCAPIRTKAITHGSVPLLIQL
jgi:hypothetical protein